MWKSLHCWENCVPLNKIQLQLRIARRFYNLSNSHLSVIDQNLIQRFVPEFYIISKLSLQKNQPINLISISNKTNFSKSQLFNYNNSNTLNAINVHRTNFTRRMSSEAEKEGASTSTKSKIERKNHLSKEKSPYLLQHADNPVEWYPWGEEAIERARRENKLIFLSVGYSTCHWCHVMAHESFENEQVAEIMNRHFINIKVDREERPDIDRLYMQFIVMMSGSGGWPMSVWLTPELTPITAGTYFPPHDQWRMPSFTTVLKAIASKWASNKDELRNNGTDIMMAIRKSVSAKRPAKKYESSNAEAFLQESLLILKKRFDAINGGFGTHPKFPEVPRLNLVLHGSSVTRSAETLKMVLHTLQCIGRGGIHDHVFDGFCRYSVDENWHVPHFEKMLYDQGQLMTAYVTAFKLTGVNTYLEYANGIYRYLITCLQHPMGGFYAGEDADSLPQHGDTEKIEGAFYTWTMDEIKQVLSEKSNNFKKLQLRSNQNVFDIYAYHYGILATGNVPSSSDPHGHLTYKNVLLVKGSLQQTCEKFGLQLDTLKTLLTMANNILYEERKKRPSPHLDTKIICSWNSLVLSGLSKLATCEGSNRLQCLDTAQKLMKFIRDHLYDKEKKILKRVCYGLGLNDKTVQHNETEIVQGFLDDYAFLVKGLLDYYLASLDMDALNWAKELQDIQDTLFWDSENGAYFYSQANATNVIVRLKDDHDSSEPSGNSIAAQNLLLLSHYFEEPKYKAQAERIFAYYSEFMEPFGLNLPEMLSALLLHENGLNLVVTANLSSEQGRKFINICRQYYIPAMLIFPLDSKNETFTQFQDKYKAVNDLPTAYLCHDKVCQLPITDLQELETTLQDKFLMTDLT